MNYARCIIVTEKDAVNEVFLVFGDTENSVTIKSEEVFRQACIENDESFEDEHTSDEIEDIVSGGDYEFGYGAITLVEPMIVNAEDY